MGNAVVVERMGAWSHSTKQRTRGTLEGSIVEKYLYSSVSVDNTRVIRAKMPSYSQKVTVDYSRYAGVG